MNKMLIAALAVVGALALTPVSASAQKSAAGAAVTGVTSGPAFGGGGGGFRGGGAGIGGGGFRGGGTGIGGGGAGIGGGRGGFGGGFAGNQGYGGRGIVNQGGYGRQGGYAYNRGGRGYGRGYGYGAAGLGLGLGLGLAAGGAYGGYYNDPYYNGGTGYAPAGYGYEQPVETEVSGGGQDDVAYCQQRFRSYDVRSGTYLGNDGQRHSCP